MLWTMLTRGFDIAVWV